MNDAEIMTTALVASLFFRGNHESARAMLKQHGSIPHMLSKSRFSRRLYRIKAIFIILFDLLGKIWTTLNPDAIYSNNSSPSLIVTLTPTGCMMPWSQLGGIFQVYIKFLHARFRAFPLALTLYHIYIYQHKTCSTNRRMRYAVSLVTMCRNFVYISAALWRIDTTTCEGMVMHIALTLDVEVQDGTLVLTDRTGPNHHLLQGTERPTASQQDPPGGPLWSPQTSARRWLRLQDTQILLR
jgi:hypothetical protein